MCNKEAYRMVDRDISTNKDHTIPQFCIQQVREREAKMAFGHISQNLWSWAFCCWSCDHTLYHVPSFKPLNHGHILQHGNQSKPHSHRKWVLGTFLRIISNIGWSMWLVMQVCSLLHFGNGSHIIYIRSGMSIVNKRTKNYCCFGMVLS